MSEPSDDIIASTILREACLLADCLAKSNEELVKTEQELEYAERCRDRAKRTYEKHKSDYLTCREWLHTNAHDKFKGLHEMEKTMPPSFTV